jgi:hypothetical protein
MFCPDFGLNPTVNEPLFGFGKTRKSLSLFSSIDKGEDEQISRV